VLLASLPQCFRVNVLNHLAGAHSAGVDDMFFHRMSLMAIFGLPECDSIIAHASHFIMDVFLPSLLLGISIIQNQSSTDLDVAR